MRETHKANLDAIGGKRPIKYVVLNLVYRDGQTTLTRSMQAAEPDFSRVEHSAPVDAAVHTRLGGRRGREPRTTDSLAYFS